ncbi:hypothetical protein D3C78_1419180 [compost metagenome]
MGQGPFAIEQRRCPRCHALHLQHRAGRQIAQLAQGQAQVTAAYRQRQRQVVEALGEIGRDRLRHWRLFGFSGGIGRQRVLGRLGGLGVRFVAGAIVPVRRQYVGVGGGAHNGLLQSEQGQAQRCGTTVYPHLQTMPAQANQPLAG